MKAEIAHLEKLWDNAKCMEYWQITIFTEQEPPYKLGKCDVVIKQ